MPTYIIKIHDKKVKKDYYMEWSTVVDAPVSEGYSLEDFTMYYQSRYGADGMEKLKERMIRVEESGCSAHDENLDEIISSNRAGKHEKRLSKTGILDRYCRPETKDIY